MYAHISLEADFLNAKKCQEALSNFKSSLPKLIDSTVLKPETTEEKILALCDEALEYEFRSVCVPPAFVATAKARLQLKKSNVLVCTVIGFPNGNTCSESKYFETRTAIKNGADEIDFVQNVGWVKGNKWRELENEYRGIVEAAQGKLVKIILETSLLSPDEIAKCALLAAKSGVHVIKTSTGFGARGASAQDIETIARVLSEYKKQTQISVGIKASGGIRSTKDAEQMIALGATRLGTSGGAAIVNGAENNSSY